MCFSLIPKLCFAFFFDLLVFFLSGVDSLAPEIHKQIILYDLVTSRSQPNGRPITHSFIFEINPLENKINLKCLFDLLKSQFLLKQWYMWGKWCEWCASGASGGPRVRLDVNYWDWWELVKVVKISCLLLLSLFLSFLLSLIPRVIYTLPYKLRLYMFSSVCNCKIDMF